MNRVESAGHSATPVASSPKSVPANRLFWALAAALALTVLGDVVAESLALPVPGAAVGLGILACVFVAQGGADAASGQLFDVISPHLPLLFIPAAAGVVANLDLLSQTWMPVAVAIVVGTAITLIVTGLVAQRLLRRSALDKAE